ncbi:MAG: hypothetical protein PWQ67_1156 [Clostridia bacterium]|nr:hypothetical protein [Clostridia bacterium]MDN5322702.1 hypothetical protein [Clostridia bacterium]
MINNIKKFFSIFIIFIIFLNFFPSSLAAQEKKLIFGEIKKINKNSILVDNKNYFLNTNPLIIFSDNLGSELITDLELIPEKIFGECTLDENNLIETIKISGKVIDLNNTLIKKIYEFNSSIYDFKLSSSGQYLAYYSWDTGLLNILNLNKKQIICQLPLENPAFDWFSLNILTFSNTYENSYEIYNINVCTLEKKLIIREKISNPIINNLSWSKNGNYLAYIILNGLPNSHGYSQLKIVKKFGSNIFKENISDVNYISWSPQENYLAYSKFINSDLASSKVGIINISTNKVYMLPDDQIQLNPIFTLDGNSLIYCDLNNLKQNIKKYSLITKKTEILFEEVKYVSNFSWLNQDQLVFTFGDLPQIKIYNIKYKKNLILDRGLSPLVLKNKVYFLKTDMENNKTSLYVYNNEK